MQSKLAGLTKIMQVEKKQSISLSIGIMILLFLTYTYVCSAIAYVVGAFPLAFALILGIILSFLTICILFEKKCLIVSSIIFILIFILSVIISINIYDYSFDGNFYHQEIITALCQGWNPYIDTFGIKNLELWDYHYAKALEIIASTIVYITDSLEAGKAVNIFLMICSLFIGYHFFKYELRIVGKFHNIALLTISMLNPVFICQVFTYYIDYSIYYYIFLSIISSISIAKRQNVILNYIILNSAMILAIGTKFNAFFMEGVVIACSVLAFYIFNRKNIIKKFCLNAVIVGIFGAAFIAYHPYVTNFVFTHNPLYPLIGNDAVDIMTASTPIQFLGSNRYVNFFASIFSFTIPYVDSRIGGFGPLFSIIFLYCITIIVISIIREKKISILNYIMICSIISCLFFEQSWWARYNTQLWLIAPCCYYYFITHKIYHQKLLVKSFVVITLLNIFIASFYTLRFSVQFKIERSAMFTVLEGKCVYLNNSRIQWKRQLEQNGIIVSDNKNIEYSNSDTIYYYGSNNGKHEFPYILITKKDCHDIEEQKQNAIYNRMIKIAKSIKE